MPQEGFPSVQSTLYQSPYSGCSWFSGWPRARCASPPVQSTWYPARARPAAFCVDRCYPKPPQRPALTKQVSVSRIGWASRPGQMLSVEVTACGYNRPQSSTIVPCGTKPPYNIAKGIRGPSSNGPFTYAAPAADDFNTYNAVSSGGTNPGV